VMDMAALPSFAMYVCYDKIGCKGRKPLEGRRMKRGTKVRRPQTP
jgi:hypothetical protein